MDPSSLGSMADKLAGQYVGSADLAAATSYIAQATDATKAEAVQKAENLETSQADLATKPVVIDKKPKPLPKRPASKISKTAATEGRKTFPAEELNKRAKEFDQTHPELGGEALKKLHSEIEKDENPTVESLLAKVTKAFPKKSQASDALGFLLLTTKGPLREVILEAKKQFDTDPKNSKEIEEGKVVTEIARSVAKDVEGSAKHIDNVFTNMVAEQPEATTLYIKLVREYPSEKAFNKFTESILKNVHSSLDKQGELDPSLLATCSLIQTVQSMRGVIKEFNKTMSVIDSTCNHAGFQKPADLTSFKMGTNFIDMCDRRNISASQVANIVNNMVTPSSAPAAQSQRT